MDNKKITSADYEEEKQQNQSHINNDNKTKKKTPDRWSGEFQKFQYIPPWAAAAAAAALAAEAEAKAAEEAIVNAGGTVVKL